MAGLEAMHTMLKGPMNPQFSCCKTTVLANILLDKHPGENWMRQRKIKDKLIDKK